jgi:5-methylcytosine-specific restriction endonuclease McrA
VKPRIPKSLLKRIKKVGAKRPRTVLKHIIAHGFVTTEELRDVYGYDHPPRAARDVRELGIPLETFNVRAKSGRKIAAYRLALGTPLERWKASGRRAFPKKVKEELLKQRGPYCAMCRGEFHPTYLQVDHKIPYEVAGDTHVTGLNDFMLLCRSCNRSKSWTCEHCMNWKKLKKRETCLSCYWADPSTYEHVAMAPVRRADVSWIKGETKYYDKFRDVCEKKASTVQAGIKELIAKSLK